MQFHQIQIDVPQFVHMLLANIFCQVAAKHGYAERLHYFNEDTRVITFKGTADEKVRLLKEVGFHVQEQFPLWYRSTLKYHLQNNLQAPKTHYKRIKN